MAITKTKTLKYLEVFPASHTDTTKNNGNPRVLVYYKVSADDPTDDELPVSSDKTVNLVRYSDEENAFATDVTGEDQLVQDICGAIWS